MKPFRYLYYRFYLLMIRVGNADVAEYGALFLMIMVIMMNIYTLDTITYLIGHGIDLGLDTGFKIVMFALLPTTMFYFYFVYNKKYLKIAASYENESKKSKTIGMLAAFGYFLLSMFLLFFSVFLLMKKNRGEL